jgi:hypothetical protein
MTVLGNQGGFFETFRQIFASYDIEDIFIYKFPLTMPLGNYVQWKQKLENFWKFSARTQKGHLESIFSG